MKVLTKSEQSHKDMKMNPTNSRIDWNKWNKKTTKCQRSWTLWKKIWNQKLKSSRKKKENTKKISQIELNRLKNLTEIWICNAKKWMRNLKEKPKTQAKDSKCWRTSWNSLKRLLRAIKKNIVRLKCSLKETTKCWKTNMRWWFQSLSNKS